MRTLLGRKLEMVARVRSFSRSHPSEEPGYLKILAELEERLGQAEAMAGTHVDELVAEKSARRRRDDIRKVVHFQLLRYLVEVGVVAAKDRAELASRFKLPDGNASNRQFAALVASMLTVAVSQKGAMVKAGMSPTLLDELRAMLTEFQVVTEAARSAKLGHVLALVELEGVTSQLSRLVRLLDGFNRWRFRGDPELLKGWGVVRRVARGPRRLSEEGEGETPAGPGGVAPAA